MFQVSQPHAKCSKISNTYLFLLSTKMLVIKALEYKISTTQILLLQTSFGFYSFFSAKWLIIYNTTIIKAGIHNMLSE